MMKQAGLLMSLWVLCPGISRAASDCTAQPLRVHVQAQDCSARRELLERLGHFVPGTVRPAGLAQATGKRTLTLTQLDKDRWSLTFRACGERMKREIQASSGECQALMETVSLLVAAWMRPEDAEEPRLDSHAGPSSVVRRSETPSPSPKTSGQSMRGGPLPLPPPSPSHSRPSGSEPSGAYAGVLTASSPPDVIAPRRPLSLPKGHRADGVPLSEASDGAPSCCDLRLLVSAGSLSGVGGGARDLLPSVAGRLELGWSGVALGIVAGRSGNLRRKVMDGDLKVSTSWASVVGRFPLLSHRGSSGSLLTSAGLDRVLATTRGITHASKVRLHSLSLGAGLEGRQALSSRWFLHASALGSWRAAREVLVVEGIGNVLTLPRGSLRLAGGIGWRFL